MIFAKPLRMRSQGNMMPIWVDICSSSGSRERTAESRAGIGRYWGSENPIHPGFSSSTAFPKMRGPKNARANITAPERAALSANATALIGASGEQIEALKAKGTIVEMECGQ
jgi:hypothetical protein